MEKTVSKFTLSLLTFFSVLVIFTPYFTNNFLDLGQEKENKRLEAELLREKQATEKRKRDSEDRLYLMGKFNPEKRADFAVVPLEFNIAGYRMYLRKETLDAFSKMAELAKGDGVNLKVTSGTRNFDYQKDLWNNKWNGATFVEGKNLSQTIEDGAERFQKILEYSAAPGTSRHHWGTEIDINSTIPKFFETEEGEKVYAWLKTNARAFGFCQTYNAKDITRLVGYNEEKWHWSYLPISRELTQKYKILIKEEDIGGFLGEEYAAGENLINNYVMSINPECI